MLLRRMMEHVRTQNWLAVFLDFVIVVVGVFIGIQLGNWNDVRLERSRASVYADRLLDDMKLEHVYILSLMDYMETTNAAGNRAYLGLTGQMAMDDEAIMINAFRTSQYNWYERRRTAFDEIVAAGMLSNVGDASLREVAIGLYNTPLFSIMQEEGQSAEYRRLFRETTEPVVAEALRLYCGDKEEETNGMPLILLTLDYPCETGLDPALLAQGVAALREDKALLRALRLRNAQRAGRLEDMQVTLAQLGLDRYVTDGAVQP